MGNRSFRATHIQHVTVFFSDDNLKSKKKLTFKVPSAIQTFPLKELHQFIDLVNDIIYQTLGVGKNIINYSDASISLDVHVKKGPFFVNFDTCHLRLVLSTKVNLSQSPYTTKWKSASANVTYQPSKSSLPIPIIVTIVPATESDNNSIFSKIANKGPEIEELLKLLKNSLVSG